ncbi:DUF2291 family protein [Pseudotabrizicola alkalilacus]|uniref:DUF2291 domain-containing protein n=1 Tax=Pseudotabrizicola alkalilacus TaxID=2305252 RepID=A0A411YZS4_9RHOB|nr:DUF2291 domain-containing protein [Pseudotabrizicola alkalilacus]RGP36310.1 DUF2291 domain-containing protein [Pseudotabrizicola alkalilacus]
MKQLALTAACVAAVLSLSACKIVKTGGDTDKAPAADASGDDARIAALMTETWEPKLIPAITERALTPAALRTALAGGLEAAGTAHGKAGSGVGAAWNFAIAGEGTVTAAKLDTRARVLDVDTDGDGTADLTLQLGPVVKGSALRDFSPFYDFSGFRDQIEFAKLGRALNDAASARLTVPEGDPTGKTVSFTGVLALKSPTETWLVTPISVEVMP